LTHFPFYEIKLYLSSINRHWCASKKEIIMASRKNLCLVAIAFTLVFAAAGIARALEVGDKAPDFELESTKGGKLKLSSLKGKNVLINFYVFDFSGT